MTLHYEDLTQDFVSYEGMPEVWCGHSCTIGQRKVLLEVSTYGRRRTTRIKTGKVLLLDYGTNGRYRGFGGFGIAHRCVAQIFIPTNLSISDWQLGQVNHIDCDKANNNVNNLEWCTLSQNAQHAHDNGLVDQSYKQTEEFRNNQSEAALKRLKDPAARQKFGEAHRSRQVHHFYNYETDESIAGIKYQLRNNSEKLFGFSNGTLQSILKGRKRSCRGWIYLGVISS